jgi:hypothetical protein
VCVLGHMCWQQGLKGKGVANSRRSAHGQKPRGACNASDSCHCRLPLGFDIRFPSLMNGRTNCCTGRCLPAPVAACMRLHLMHHAGTRPLGKQKLPIAC